MTLDIKIIEIKPEQGLSIREVVTYPKIAQKMAQIFGELMAFFGRNKVVVAGPPFALYHSFDDEKTDMEVGFPVAGPQKGEGRIKPCTLPGGKVVTATFVGPYERLSEAYAEMQRWIAAKQLKPSTVMWERYMNGPDTVKDPSGFITQLFWPFD